MVTRAQPPPPGEGLCVLVVEDHADSARALEILLRRRGHCPHVAHCCAEARAATAVARFHLALCDVGLPDGDGLDLIRELRDTRRLPCVAVTGHAMSADAAEYQRAGIEIVLVKPYTVEQLAAAVDRAMGAARTTR